MPTDLAYQFLADAVVVVHLAIVVFVVGGLVLVLAGNLRRWTWVNGVGFRLTHACAIAFVIAESWLGATCPLTALEAWLRSRAGETPLHTSFIAYWVHRLLFYQAPEWVFTVLYTIFGLAVAVAWWYFPPRRCGRPRTTDS